MKTFWEQCKVRLIPDISDELVEKMAQQIQPVMATPNGRFRLVDTTGVHRRNTAFTWEPKLGRLVKIYSGSLNCVQIMTFHTWGAPALFKPSLAEVYACINQYLPDWSQAKFFWLDSESLDRRNVIGDYHWCRCVVFGPEQERVIDDEWERDCQQLAI